MDEVSLKKKLTTHYDIYMNIRGNNFMILKKLREVNYNIYIFFYEVF